MNLHESHIRALSRRLSLLSLMGLFTVPLTLAFIWASDNPLLSSEITGIDIDNIDYKGVAQGLVFWQKSLAFLASMLPGGILMWGAWQLKLLFDRFAALEFFTIDSINRLKGFAKALILAAPLHILSGALISVITSINNSPGERVVSISLGFGHFSILFIGLVVLMIAHVMGEGQKLKEENDQFV